jgi:Domain of unknown function (DUF3332)
MDLRGRTIPGGAFMNRRRALLFSLTLLALLAFPGCLGRFAMSGAVQKFNLDLTTDQWGRELAFVGLYIIPVYPIAMFGDLFVVNSIEFWSGENPMTGESPLSLAAAPAAPSQ